MLPKIIRTGIHRYKGTGVRKTQMATQYRKAYVPVTLDIEQFVHRVKRNSTLTELTLYALRELVKAVYVDAPDKSSGKRRQKVHIEYDLVGYIPVDELLKAEQA